MPSTATNRLQGLTTSVAVKPPCVAISIVPITLAGLQTVGGVVLAEGDRVLVRAQSSAVDNGIYNASTGSWTRATDFDGDLDAVQGTLVLVRTDTVDGNIYELTTANPIVIGTSSLNFELFQPFEAAEPESGNHIQTRQARGEFTLPATVYYFGDSFWEQPNGHTSSGDSMAYKSADILGVIADIDATSGNTSADKQDAIFSANPVATDIFCTNLGQNDAQFIGTGTDVERRLNDVALIHLANQFQMAVPSGSRRYLASAMTAAGSWSADADIAEGGALKSTTNGSALQADVADSRFIVVIFKLKASSGGTFSVVVDGTTYTGAFDSAGFHSAPFAQIPTNTAKTYARAALVFDTGRRKASTAVQMVVTSATNAANIVSICSVMGLSGAPLAGPLAVICDLSDRGPDGYATATGSQAAVPIISRIANFSLGVAGACGLRVVPVAISTALNANTMLDTDEFHPNEDGAVAGGQAIADAITDAARDWSVNRPDLDAQSFVNGANGYVLLAQNPVVIDADWQMKRKLMSPRAIDWSDVVPVATSIRIVLKDGTGSYNSDYALYLHREAADAGIAYTGNIGNGDYILVAKGASRARLSDTNFYPVTASQLDIGSVANPFSYAWLSKAVVTLPLTVATLPTAAAGLTGARAFVTDANATTFNATVAGGGANKVPVFCDGAVWKIG